MSTCEGEVSKYSQVSVTYSSICNHEPHELRSAGKFPTVTTEYYFCSHDCFLDSVKGGDRAFAFGVWASDEVLLIGEWQAIRDAD